MALASSTCSNPLLQGTVVDSAIVTKHSIASCCSDVVLLQPASWGQGPQTKAIHHFTLHQPSHQKLGSARKDLRWVKSALSAGVGAQQRMAIVLRAGVAGFRSQSHSKEIGRTWPHGTLRKGNCVSLILIPSQAWDLQFLMGI